MAGNVVFLVLQGCSTGGPGPTLLDNGFLYCILSTSSLDPNSSGPKWPLWPDVAFPTTSRLQLYCNCPSNSTVTWLPSWLRYIIVQRPLDRLLDLWNRRFNSHQMEITVMQFKDHSLSVHQSMSVSWALPCPILSANFRPRDFLS